MSNKLRSKLKKASQTMSDRMQQGGKKANQDYYERFAKNFQKYDLMKEIKNHEWNNGKYGGRIKAFDWYRKYRKEREHWLKGQLMRQGHMYMFDYRDPKYKDTLPWFDENPLVICFGRVKTSLGWRTLNINLHLLPPKTRQIVLAKIFELYRGAYKKNMSRKDPNEVQLLYRDIVKALKRYGVQFAIRMYIPELQKNVVEIRVEEWKNAIFLESRRLNGTTAPKLQAEWEAFVSKYNADATNRTQLRKNWFTS